VVPRARWWADGGKEREVLARFDPYPEACPPDLLQRQADQYARLFRLLRAHADTVDRVTFWNLHDGESWLNGFPWRRTNHPLLFDRALRPKPAFWGVVAGEAPRPPALEYNSPAAQWVEALPVGNGRLGAMVFGGVPEERVQFNESTLWLGRP